MNKDRVRGLNIMDLNSSHDVSSPTAKDASSGGTNPNPTAEPDPTPTNSFRLAPDPPIEGHPHNRAERRVKGRHQEPER